MCGIVATFSTSAYGMGADEMKAFYNLLIANSARGEDGTGYFWMDGNGKRWFWRDAKTAGACVTRQVLYDHLDDCRFVVGHNRASTIGANTVENTHPHHFGHVIGVHNGTVSGWQKLLDVEEATMDSAAIMEALSKADPDPASVNEVLTKLEGGDYALVWHDSRVGELRMVRNAQRPLYLMSTSRAVWVGSEYRLLEWALVRNREYPSYSFSLDTHTLLCINQDGGEATTHTMDVPKPAALKPYSGAYATGYINSTGNWNRFGMGENRDWLDAWDSL